MNSSDRSRRHLPNIGRNEVGIPLACPQICDRMEPVVAESSRPPKFDGPAIADQAQGTAAIVAQGQISTLLRRLAVLRERLKGKR
jgi:hypothetical protein